jgi:Domain of unknown function (DUF4386)
MAEEINPNKNTAKLAGLVYFLFAAVSIYSYVYLRPKVMVPGDIAAICKSIVANEFLYRTSIAADILGKIYFVAVVILLYHLFSQVNKFYAKFRVVLVIAAISVSFIGESLRIVAFQICKGNLLKSFSTLQAEEAAETLLKIDDYSVRLIQFHWGIWLIPLALLVYKSGFIPRLFGISLIFNGPCYMLMPLQTPFPERSAPCLLNTAPSGGLHTLSVQRMR